MVSETNCYVNAPVTHHWFVRSHPNGSSDRTPMVHGSHKHVQNRRPVALSWFKFTPKSPSRGSPLSLPAKSLPTGSTRPLVVQIRHQPPQVSLYRFTAASVTLPVQLQNATHGYNKRKTLDTETFLDILSKLPQVSLYRFTSKTIPIMGSVLDYG